MKKVISLLIILVLLVSAVPVLVSAAPKLEYGYVDDVLYIHGKGDLPDFDSDWENFSPVRSHRAKRIVFSEGIESIGAFTFQFCEAESVSLPSTLKKIGKCAFYGCENLKEINLPEGLEYIDNMAFMDCYSLKKVVIPNSVTTLFGAVFLNCKNLEELKISDNVQYINSGLVLYCENLKKLEIGKNVRGEELNFNGVKNLEEIIVHPDNPSYKAVDNVLFDKSMTTLMVHPKKDGGEYTVPDSVTKAMFGAFLSCENMVINLPAGVDEYSFMVNDSVRLTSEEIEQKYKKADYEGDEIFYTVSNINTRVTIHRVNDLNGDEKFAIPPFFSEYEEGHIKDGVFSFDKITTVNAQSLTKLPNNMFAGKKVESVILSDNLTQISSNAFGSCKNLREIRLPGGLKKICSGAFTGCTNLKYINLPEGLETIEGAAFSYSGLEKVTIPSTVTFIGQKAFSNIPSLSRIVIKEGNLKVLDDEGYLASYKTEAFNNLNDKVDVYIPSNVEFFTDNLFKGYYLGYKGGTVWTEFPENLTIYAPKGSFASTWAAKNGVNYVECEKMPEDSNFRLRENGYNEWFKMRNIMAASINQKTETDYGTIVEWSTLSQNDVFTYITYVRYDGKTGSITALAPMKNETVVMKYKTLEISSDGKMCTITYPEIKNAGTFVITLDLINCNMERNIIPYVNGEIKEESTDIGQGSGECGVETEENQKLNWNYENGTLTISGTGDMKEFFMDMGGRVEKLYPLVRPWYEFNDNIKKIVVTNGVKSISGIAFEECKNLKEVVIGDNVTIGENAFHYLENIEKVTLGKNCTVNKNAFMFCTSLKSLTIQDGCVIGEGAFKHCYSLTQLNCNKANINVSKTAFERCPYYTDLTKDFK